MDNTIDKIGFGGGCHWCIEAVFQSLKRVEKVEQGWIKSKYPYHSFSEAVIVHYKKSIISLKELIYIHLNTHSATSQHIMRSKYRSAIYYFHETDKLTADQCLNELKIKFQQELITKTLVFNEFKLNTDNYLNYYKNNPDKPFCKTYIHPKLEWLKQNSSIPES
ncbi:peptide-methionine (S)-S-oxide reductase [Marivirga arenosa]|uniref:peptide-methionine (S)-S-oxide reductase n=1 Tax=Marivirga arenosa TaxID=3059076 RepID=A0AA49JCL9_9BACT|nr:peptide-methionine (S)-S-oxide reductase [Marivirga sp. BKB1-2]WKK80749.1 peptide-methionine (S)-S-oxide reductase [Marivirga sp. BKB1-2]